MNVTTATTITLDASDEAAELIAASRIALDAVAAGGAVTVIVNRYSLADDAGAMAALSSEAANRAVIVWTYHVPDSGGTEWHGTYNAIRTAEADA